MGDFGKLGRRWVEPSASNDLPAREAQSKEEWMSDKKSVEPPALPRGFTPTREQLAAALEVINAGISSGLLPDVSGGTSQVHPIGPGALATGYGLAGGGRKAEAEGSAHEVFIQSVRGLLDERTWEKVDVFDQSAWVQIRGARGRIYVAKTTRVVSRVESTLSPYEVPATPVPPFGATNASEPDRPHGRIRSWIRADAAVVAEAVRVIAGERVG